MSIEILQRQPGSVCALCGVCTEKGYNGNVRTGIDCTHLLIQVLHLCIFAYGNKMFVCLGVSVFARLFVCR